MGDSCTVKITGFHLSRFLDAEPSFNSNSGGADQSGWITPESQDTTIVLDSSIDVFLLGCFFYYVLSKQHEHPFGRISVGEHNIVKGMQFNIESIKGKLAQENDNAADLILKMIQHKRQERISLQGVLKHPYFGIEQYYDLYPIAGNGNKPGLCVIFNQELFFQVSRPQFNCGKIRTF